MTGKVNFKVGDASYQLNIDEPKDMETLHKMIVLGNPPQYCHECKNDKYFRLDTNRDKEGNIYINVVCTACGAKAKLGQYKAGGFFWRRFEKWVRPGTEDNQNSYEKDGDVPF